MTTPTRPPSRAERGDRNALRGAPEPPGGRRFHQRAMLLARAWLKWAWEWARNVLKSTHPLPPLPRGDTGVYALPDGGGPLTVGLAADWGSGTADAYAVGDVLAHLEPDITIHLGDVYYSGTTDEFEDFFLPKTCWPRGRSGTYLLNGNHEMYSGGEGYFERALPAYGHADLLLIRLGLKRDSTRLPALEPHVPVVVYDERSGPNPIGDKAIGLNGFASLRFDDGGGLIVRYYDQLSQRESDFLLEEEWRAQDSGVAGVNARLGERGKGPNGLKVVRDLQELMR